MCYYQTHKDGTLVIWNLHPEKVEQLYLMKVHRDSLSLHTRLDEFIHEAEMVLFEDHGRFMNAWLRSMSEERRKAILNMDELEEGGRDDCECDVKLQIRSLVKDFMKISRGEINV